MNRKGTIEEWQEYADEINNIRNQLLEAIFNPEFQKLLPKHKAEKLLKALHHIDSFRSEAEDVMLEEFGVQPENEPAPCIENIWFGVDDTEEQLEG